MRRRHHRSNRDLRAERSWPTSVKRLVPRDLRKLKLLLMKEFYIQKDAPMPRYFRMTAKIPDPSPAETLPAEGGADAPTAPDVPRNQYGRTWEEHRVVVEEQLRSLLTEEQFAHEMAIQRRQFEIFSGFIAEVDGRQAQLQRSFDATPPDRRERIFEAARRSWK